MPTRRKGKIVAGSGHPDADEPSSDGEGPEEIVRDFLPPSSSDKGSRVSGVRRKGKTQDDKEEPSRTRSRPATSKWKDLQEELESVYIFIADVWEIRDPECARVLRNHAPKMAEAWVDRAKASPRIEKWLTTMSTGSGWAGLVGAHAPLFFAIYTHHVVLGGERQAMPHPDNQPGTGPITAEHLQNMVNYEEGQPEGINDDGYTSPFGGGFAGGYTPTEGDTQ